MKKGEEKGRIITHILYEGWPDFGIPKETSQLDAIHEMVKGGEAGSGPVIVHCSAGVGRSGVFVAQAEIRNEIEKQVDDYQKKDLGLSKEAAVKKVTISLSKIVEKIRQSRECAVQSVGQYQYLYLCAQQELQRYLSL